MSEAVTEIDQAMGEHRAGVARPSLPRRRFFNDMPDRGLFALTALIGTTLIIGLKLEEIGPQLVALLAGALMIVYGIIAYRIPAVHLRLDRLGDNFYYLGFIFTLASMSAALLQLQLRRGADIEAMLGSFGIALFTTIIGVGGRVLFVQMRGEIDEVEAAVRRELLEASADLKAQLSLALREFETFHFGVKQAADESMSDSGRLVQAQVDNIGEVARAAAEQTKTMFDANRTQAEELSQIISDVSRTVQEISQNLTKMELPTGKFENQLSSLGDTLETMTARVEQLVEHMEKATKIRRRRWWWPFGRRGSK